jgi:hypothetical protein
MTEAEAVEDAGGTLAINRKSGGEKFRHAATVCDFGLLEFWQWSASDLVSNTMRGVLAEYIVAEALGIAQIGVRSEWGEVELVALDGTRIEIKSAAYVQSGEQARHSVIQFNVEKRRGWKLETHKLDVETSFDSDVHVFALLNHKDGSMIDPMDLSQWEFYVLATRALDTRARGPQSITLNALRALAGKPVAFARLAAAIHALGKPKRAAPAKRAAVRVARRCKRTPIATPAEPAAGMEFGHRPPQRAHAVHGKGAGRGASSALAHRLRPQPSLPVLRLTKAGRTPFPLELPGRGDLPVRR